MMTTTAPITRPAHQLKIEIRHSINSRNFMMNMMETQTILSDRGRVKLVAD
jgi:hypothetical protein